MYAGLWMTNRILPQLGYIDKRLCLRRGDTVREEL